MREYLWLFIGLLFLAACGRPSYLKDGQYLLSKNSLLIEKQKYKIQEEPDNIYYELEPILIQKPNQKLLFTRPRLFFYQLFYKAPKEKKVRYWFANKVGEKPTILDSTLCAKTAKSMRYQLNHKGYFSAQVDYKIRYKRKSASVSDHVTTNPRTLIDSVFFNSADSNIQRILNAEMLNSGIKNNQPLDKNLFEIEKSRLTMAIRNKGYEKFSPFYVNFEADTVNTQKYAPAKRRIKGFLEQGEPRANVYINILPYSDTSAMHPQYTINQVFVYPEEVVFQPHQKNRFVKQDSVFITYKDAHKKELAAYKSDTLIPPNERLLHIILHKKGSKAALRDKVLSEAILLHRGELYNYQKNRQTIQQISELDVYKFPRVEYVPSLRPDGTVNPQVLDCIIKMRPSDKQVMSTDVEVNTYNINLGSAVNFNYRNRNLFRGAETFAFNMELGGVFRLKQDSSLMQSTNALDRFISLLDINTEASLFFPRFVGPGFLRRKATNANTKFSIGYRFLRQGTDIQVSSIYARFLSYEWKLLDNNRHAFSLNPILLNITFEPRLSTAFEEKLAQNNLALLTSLKDRFIIPSTDFTYTYNTPDRKAGNAWFLKIYAEFAGNSLYAVDKLIAPNTPFRFFNNLDYSQYVKIDTDVRYSYYINRKNSLVSRIMFGAALPFGNAADRGMPFSKRFFLGGPSSMRAWTIRQIGPGRVAADPLLPFQLGDIRLELNTEWRFKFNSWIAGALFVDAGNLWLWKSTNQTASNPPFAPTETGVMDWDFLKELAICSGFGLRLDFSLFIIRLDYGIQLYNPAGYGLLPNGKIQYWNSPRLRVPFSLFKPFTNSNLVLAIGYPF